MAVRRNTTNRRTPYLPCGGNCLLCDLRECWLDNTEEDDFSMLHADDYRAKAIKDALDSRTLKQKRRAEYWRSYHQDHHEERLAYQKKYREAHKEKMAAYKREYRATHKEELAAKDREYYATHKEQKAAYKREYRATHKEELAAKDRERYLANKDKIAARNREYHAAHRETINARKRARYAARKQVEAEMFVLNIQPWNARRCAPMLEVVSW